LKPPHHTNSSKLQISRLNKTQKPMSKATHLEDTQQPKGKIKWLKRVDFLPKEVNVRVNLS
jgi:ABC-type antimicrobial peptide transport system ATPase subunit